MVFPDRVARPILASRIELEIVHHGTHEAYLSLVAGDADLILVARGPSSSEAEAARSAGVALDVRPIALDALVFVVNASNPVEGLTLDQLRSVYGPGRLPGWTVGGPGMPIQPCQREPDSGSQELIQKLVMGDLPMRDAAGAPVIHTMGGVVHAVAMREWGIAFSIYYYVTNMAPNPATKLLAIEGVPPSPETIAAGAYPLTAEVHAGVREDAPPGSTAVLLRDWLLSEPGQAAIRESGYAPGAADPPVGLRARVSRRFARAQRRDIELLYDSPFA